MNIILLSGGSGKRLWPASNDIRSKQFLKIFKNENGIYESMLQRMYRQIKSVDRNAIITIATSKEQVALLKEQLGEEANISVEPCRRNTFPAIALATAYLHDINKVSLDDVVVVCPVDPYVDEEYFCSIRALEELAKKCDCNLSLLGVSPTHPSEKFGYIIPEKNDNISKVALFKEKPDKETACKYIEQGAMWNAGVFAFKIKYVLDIANQLFGTSNYTDLYNQYETLTKISFDYAVVEKEESVQVMRFNGQWDDLGTWDSLTEILDESIIGSGMLSDTCENVHIVNDLNIPVLCMGLKDVVVSASFDGILVADKKQSTEIKKLVDLVDEESYYTEQSWGKFRVLDVTSNSKILKLIISPNQQIQGDVDSCKREMLSVVEGSGTVVIDGEKHSFVKGDVFSINKECNYLVCSECGNVEIVVTQVWKTMS